MPRKKTSTTIDIERQRTRSQCEIRVAELWGYVRLNKNSLDGGRIRDHLRDTIEGAVAQIQRRVEMFIAERDLARAEMRVEKEWRREADRERDEIEDILWAYEECTKRK